MRAFSRLLPKKTWIQGPGLRILCWSVAAALCEALVLLGLVLLIDLLAGRGRVELTGAELTGDASWISQQVLPGLPEEMHAASAYQTEGVGLAATAIRYHDRWFGRLTASLCQAVPALSDNAAALPWMILFLAVVSLLRSVAQARIRINGLGFATQRTRQLRQSIHRQALRLVPSDLDGSEEAETFRLFDQDVRGIDEAIRRWVRRCPPVVLVTVALLALSLAFDWRLTLQCLVPLGMMLWVFHYAGERARHARALAESLAERELRILAEGVRQSRLIRGYGMEDFEREQFEKHLERYTQGVAAGRTRQTWSIWMARTCTILCLALIGYLISARVLSPVEPLPLSAAGLVLLTLARLSVASQLVPHLREDQQTINVCGDRVYRYLNEIPEVGQAVGAKFLEPVAQSIIYESVSYRDNGRDVLNGLDLRIRAGSVTAIVSTDRTACRAAAFLLPRFIEPLAGRVLFDSEDTTWATLESLRAETLYVGGAEPVFSGSVRENLICGDQRFSLQDATEAAKLAHAHQFIVKLAQGYDTILGEHGEQLRPGEAFRLALARAVLRNPAVLIIEEPPGPLDDDTKALLDDAYSRILKGRTVIFLPSRLSTVRRCDQVALLQDGRLAALGKHAQVVADSEAYRHWEYMTFKARRPDDVPVGA